MTDASGAVVLPLLATQILWINLVTDSGPALAMAVDPQTEDVMARRPRRLTDCIIDARMWWGVVLVGLVMALTTLLTLDLLLPGGWLDADQSIEAARTAAFTMLVLAQLFNAFNARSETVSAFNGIFRNHWLWGAVGLVVVLQVAVMDMPLLNLAFNTTPLTLSQWALCAVMSSVVLWFSELSKFLLRRKDAIQQTTTIECTESGL